jgi:hypothetical protein
VEVLEFWVKVLMAQPLLAMLVGAAVAVLEVLMALVDLLETAVLAAHMVQAAAEVAREVGTL